MKRKIHIGYAIFDAVNILFFTLFTLLCIFPFYYIFINTISDNKLVSLGKVIFFPLGIHFGNYYEVLSIKGIGMAALVSLARTVLGTTLTLLGSAFMGYVFCRQEYWHRKFWYRFVVIAMYFNAGLIPGFVLIKNIGLYNNFFVYIIPGIVIPFYVILFKTFIEQIPASLEESVQIDGGGYFVRFFRIILPLSTPILIYAAVPVVPISEQDQRTGGADAYRAGEAQHPERLRDAYADIDTHDDLLRGRAAHIVRVSVSAAVFHQGDHDRRDQRVACHNYMNSSGHRPVGNKKGSGGNIHGKTFIQRIGTGRCAGHADHGDGRLQQPGARSHPGACPSDRPGDGGRRGNARRYATSFLYPGTNRHNVASRE
jgi:ABC-type glycerol-3-phosphate transport system permease component